MSVPKKQDERKSEVKEYPVEVVKEERHVEKLKSMVAERPYAAGILGLQLLDDLVDVMEDTLEKISQLATDFRAEIPRGKIIPRVVIVPATQRPVEISSKTDKTIPWISFDIFNDGPGSIYITVNEDYVIETSWLALGESLTVDMKVPIIEKIYLHAVAAVAATVRIFAKR